MNAKKWVSFWSPQNNDIVYGKTLAYVMTNNNTKMIYFEHWIRHHKQNDITSSPHSRPLTISRCPGCSLHEPHYFSNDIRPVCTLYLPLNSLLKANVNSLPMRTTCYIAQLKSVPLHFNQRITAYNDYRFRCTNDLPSPSTIVTHRSDSAHLDNLFMGSQIAISELKKILLINIDTDTTNFEFYTDGSLKSHDNIPLLGLGWVLLSRDHNSVLHKFSCSSINWPSATRAESLAILTAISTLPINSNAIINTDSQNCIDNFKNLVSNTLHMRKFQKVKNFSIWLAISCLIKYRNLTIRLNKVPAHSNCLYNDQADELAKLGTQSGQDISVRNNANNLTACLTWRLPNNQNIMIDRNIRHAISTIQNNIQMDELLNHHKMSYLKNGILHANIDLYWTKIWLKWNPFEKLTSQQLSKTIGKRIRTITQQLPTGDILNRNYPLLIKDIPTCPQCNVVAETQDHFWSCPNTISNLYTITVNNINTISMVIHDNNPKISLSVIVNSFYSTDTFKWINFFNPTSLTNTYTKISVFFANTQSLQIFQSFSNVTIVPERILPLLSHRS